MADKKLYMVETISLFRMRYVVEANEAEHASDEVICELGNSKFQEFSQRHVDELITGTREITQEEYLKQFDIDNEYLSSWTPEQKFNYINKINYGDSSEESQ